MKAKIQQFFDYYLVHVIVALVLIAIVGYFVKTIAFDRTEIVLSVMILGDSEQLDTEQMKADLEEVLGITSDKREVTVTIMDNTVAQNEAIIWTRLRAKSVDVLIADKDTFDQYAMNSTYANLEETFTTGTFDLLQDKMVESKAAVLDDDGNVTEWGESLPYGVLLKDQGKYMQYGSGLTDPIAGMVVNTEHKEKAMETIAYFAGI